MALTRIDDWTALSGSEATVRQDCLTVCEGLVDAVTLDGEILWIRPKAGTRKLFEKAAYEVWAEVAEDQPALSAGGPGQYQPGLHPHPSAPTHWREER